MHRTHDFKIILPSKRNEVEVFHACAHSRINVVAAGAATAVRLAIAFPRCSGLRAETGRAGRYGRGGDGGG
jgi:hypothetical protein